MSRYDSFRALASRLIARNGREVTYQRQGEATPDGTTKPWEVDTSDFPQPSEENVRAVIVPIMHMKIDGSTVLRTDKTAFISAADIETVIEGPLRPNDTVVDSVNDRVFVVKEVEDISPGEQKVLYILQLRGND